MPSSSPCRPIFLLLVLFVLCIGFILPSTRAEVAVPAVPYPVEEQEVTVQVQDTTSITDRKPHDEEQIPQDDEQQQQQHHQQDEDSPPLPPHDEPKNQEETENRLGNKSNQQQQHQHHDCAWGTACYAENSKGDRIRDEQVSPELTISENQEGMAESFTEDNKVDAINGSSINNSNDNSKATPSAGGHIPFVKHHHPNHVKPPEGFDILARVYTDPNDKLAHFTDDSPDTHITLPYWECGATGSTTSPLPVKHAYFRHALSGLSKPTVWSGTEYGPHPQLIVALKCVEMTLNSGETRQLKSGDVVLMEDVVSGGHKCTSCEQHYHHHSPEEDHSMLYLVLTLPQHYHHVGRDRVSLKRASMEKGESPCANEDPNLASQGGSAFLGNKHLKPKKSRKQLDREADSSTSPSWDGNNGTTKSDGAGLVAPLRDGKVRKLLLGAVGVSLSTLMADFLGKVAPLWLAVGIGGTCFVVGGTIGIVQGGDYLLTEIEMWQERKRLDLSDYGIDAEGDDSENTTVVDDEVNGKEKSPNVTKKPVAMTI